MKIGNLFFALTFLSFSASAQTQNVFSEDIDRFWQAYDSIQTTTDSLKQLQYIQQLYLDKATPGLKAFMEARDYDAKRYVMVIRKYPSFWKSIRPNTLSVKKHVPEIERSVQQFKKIYPALKDAKIYFTVGGLRSGGTTSGNLVLIGTEIAMGDSATNVSDFPDKWLANVFAKQKPDNVVALNIHEFVHTQQSGEPVNLLGLAIQEGACDFIAERVLGKPMLTSYILYGEQHEAELKQRFKEDMYANTYLNWLYNGSLAKTMADLGYYMGYTICRSYYNNAKDKKQAIADIIELKFNDSVAVDNFLARSRYYKEPLDKKKLLETFSQKKPTVVAMEPFANGDTLVSADIKEIKFVFSKEMSPARYSFGFGKGGNEQFPEGAGKPEFAPDNRSVILKVKLKPNHTYNLIVTDMGFASSEGYPLVPYEVKFKTK